MPKSVARDRVWLGVCYYPEQWPREMWEDDFRRMRELGFDVVRMAEFAWSTMEPEEGVFRFGLFDEALDLAHRYGLKAILGTPTATPPAWLTERYPEVLNATQAGVPYRHGQRRHYNYNSHVYRSFSERIVRRMASQYKEHPAVVAWQIDNELNCETNVFYSESDHRAFRAWLIGKYGSLDRLNEAWGAAFWNQTYSSWEQVYLTRPTVSDSPNPHQALDEKRFISDSAISYAKLQADIIRELAPRHEVTTNGLFGHLDSHRLTDELLDYFSYDSYPQFGSIYPDGGDRPLRDRKWSWNLSKARSVSPQFCVMEQQSGAGGWVNRMEMPAPKPGQMRLWTYQSILHGADMVLYFRWRTAAFGTEMYWHGINDPHNRPNRRVEEAGRIGEELRRVGGAIAGKAYRADVAVLGSYDNEWDGELDRWYGPLTGYSVTSWIKTLQYAHIPVDYVNAEQASAETLERYRVVVYPHAAILSEETARELTAFAERGGIVVFGCRTGLKDENGQMRMQAFPGPVASLCGVEVEDFTYVLEGDAPKVRWTAERLRGAPDAVGPKFVDVLRVAAGDVEVLARYASDYFEGKPALTRRPVGAGAVYYYGSAFEESVAQALTAELGLRSPLLDWFEELPEQVEAGIREDDGGRVAFLLNYGSTPAAIRTKREVRELLTDRLAEAADAFELEPYGVALFSL
ncbi:beta-galactosidase [Paenibacillus antri]|uniref:Beta-galactosidase n=1 Tax=Paenibacillus antri TaxID=2582848 RepID=A0A5R9GJ07_9BACL|nr:beta-galactosidase [Paenibacillus antri]TLS51555.1 beta-galactosidase [Paenibacillus antri]